MRVISPFAEESRAAGRLRVPQILEKAPGDCGGSYFLFPSRVVSSLFLSCFTYCIVLCPSISTAKLHFLTRFFVLPPFSSLRLSFLFVISLTVCFFKLFFHGLTVQQLCKVELQELRADPLFSLCLCDRGQTC